MHNKIWCMIREKKGNEFVEDRYTKAWEEIKVMLLIFCWFLNRIFYKHLINNTFNMLRECCTEITGEIYYLKQEVEIKEKSKYSHQGCYV